MDVLRAEIVEAQKARIDFMKWKLVLVSALGAAALGIGVKSGQGVPLLIALVPFVCAYVDLVARHLNLRMLVIGTFLQSESRCNPLLETVGHYESFCTELRIAFELETWALKGSSIVLSVLVCGMGGVQFINRGWDPGMLIFLGSGILGIAVAYWIETAYEQKRAMVLQGGNKPEEESK